MRAVDARGNTVLHVCAKFGHEWLSWRSLQVAGLELLHKPNQDGDRPLDLAKKETQSPR